ncbi:3390_t:CDS:2 [Acaulospora morrowiae]|uniref:3390_t:CDS:1 n=1 Tax=Acaulospora morrowiae TaxID=94023 RepID=A0A9N9BYI4_9GLOM|nr:3390_t:CDS:2 [Acaulospora morrowiae]
MSCQGCVNAVKNVLNKFQDTAYEVELENQLVTVTTKATNEEVFNALKGTGKELAGIILIGLGLYELASPEVRFYSNVIPLATILLGVLIFLISVTGCFGAVAESKPILVTYFIVLLILVIIQVIAAIITLVDSQNVERILDTAWEKAYQEHPAIIRDIEDEYACCGFRNTTDRAIPKRTPDACVESPWFGYNKPCLASLETAYRRHHTMLAVWGIVLAVIQILALISVYILIVFLPTPEERERIYRAEHERLVRIGRGEDPEQPTKPYSVGQYGATSGVST